MVPGLRSDVGPRMVQSMEMLTGLGIDGKARHDGGAAQTISEERRLGTISIQEG